MVNLNNLVIIKLRSMLLLVPPKMGLSSENTSVAEHFVHDLMMQRGMSVQEL